MYVTYPQAANIPHIVIVIDLSSFKLTSLWNFARNTSVWLPCSVFASVNRYSSTVCQIRIKHRFWWDSLHITPPDCRYSVESNWCCCVNVVNELLPLRISAMKEHLWLINTIYIGGWEHNTCPVKKGDYWNNSWRRWLYRRKSINLFIKGRLKHMAVTKTSGNYWWSVNILRPDIKTSLKFVPKGPTKYNQYWLR